MSSFKCHPIVSLKAWHQELFDEVASLDLVPDPSDILVERRGSAIRPLNQGLAEDMWDIISSIENITKLPRTILKNGKNSKVDLDKSRRAAFFCHVLHIWCPTHTSVVPGLDTDRRQ